MTPTFTYELVSSSNAVSRRVIDLHSTEPPILIVTCDTEEEFNWTAGYDRNAVSVQAMRNIGKLQSLCAKFGILPTYVVDYPVAMEPEAMAPLREFVRAGRAVIGAHLHPWVNPPYDEKVSAFHSYGGNLPCGVEMRKLQALTSAIEEGAGVRPRVYKAGRYGIGPNTYGILRSLGYEIDMSPHPPFDFSADGGPDFSESEARPWWEEESPEMLVIPGCGAFVGWAGEMGKRWYKIFERPLLRKLRAHAVLARIGAVDRLRLSPEGYTLEENIRLTKALFDRGVRTFSLSLHSPSLEPGCTPYVEDELQLRSFLDQMQRYFDFFLHKLNGISMTPEQFKTYVMGHQL